MRYEPPTMVENRGQSTRWKEPTNVVSEPTNVVSRLTIVRGVGVESFCHVANTRGCR